MMAALPNPRRRDRPSASATWRAQALDVAGVLAPALAGALQGQTERLYVVLDGALASVPIEALPAGSDKLLCELVQVVRLAAPEALVLRSRTPLRTKGALLLGDCDFNYIAPSDVPVVTGS